MATDAAERDPDGGRDSRFRAVGELGRGGLGRVDLVDDLRLHRQVAIKVLLQPDGDAVDEFVDEARITGQLEHPNIVPVHELGFDAGGRPYLVMKRVKGQTLGEIIADRKRRQARSTLEDLVADNLLECFLKVCDAIAYVHSRGVIHRDLKPANVMVGEFGEVLVMDWGLAKPLADDDSDGSRDRDPDAAPVRSPRRERQGGAELTMDGEVFGTPAYMPPEQAEGLTDLVDRRADVFALGAILYSLLTHEPPYAGRNVTAVLAKAARRELVSPQRRAPRAGIPRELDAIVMKAMAADPGDRYATAGELRADIDALLANRPVSACKLRPHERVIKWCRRRPAMALGIGLSVLFLALAGAGTAIALAQVAAAEADRARTEAENERLERTALQAREQQRAAEQEAREAELQALAKEGRIQELFGELNARLTQERDDALQAFVRDRAEARARGESDDTFIQKIGRDRMAEVIGCYQELMTKRNKYGQEAAPVSGGELSDLAMLYFWGLHDAIQARSVINEAIRAEPDEPSHYANRAAIRRTLGELQRAREDLDRAIELGGGASCYFARGNIRAEMSDLRGAIEDFNEALERDPDHASALAQRAFQQFQLGNLPAARADAERALAIDDRTAIAHVVTALVALQQNRPQDALASCNRAIDINPDNALPWVYRAIIKRINGDTDGAIADCDESLERRKTWTAWFQRALALAADGRLDEAIDNYGKAIAILPRNPELYLNRGNAKLNAGDTTGAWMDFERAVQINPRLWQARYNQSLIRQQLGDMPGAIAALQQAYRACQQPGARQQIANRIRQLGGQVPD